MTNGQRHLGVAAGFSLRGNGILPSHQGRARRLGLAVWGVVPPPLPPVRGERDHSVNPTT